MREKGSSAISEKAFSTLYQRNSMTGKALSPMELREGVPFLAHAAAQYPKVRSRNSRIESYTYVVADVTPFNSPTPADCFM